MFRSVAISTVLVVASSAAGLALSKAHLQAMIIHEPTQQEAPAEPVLDAKFVIPEYVPTVPTETPELTQVAVATPALPEIQAEIVAPIVEQGAVETSIRPRERAILMEPAVQTQTVRATTRSVQPTVSTKAKRVAPIVVSQAPRVSTANTALLTPSYVIGVYR